MFNRSTFFRFQRFGSQVPSAAWSLVMVPGLLLVFLAFAILIWPQLLAYIVAFAILSAGVTLTGWGWALRRATKQMRKPQSGSVEYDRNGSPVIYYESQ